jgi:hypothetical protein
VPGAADDLQLSVRSGALRDAPRMLQRADPILFAVQHQQRELKSSRVLGAVEAREARCARAALSP